MEPPNERDHVGLKYNKMKYEHAKQAHYRIPPIGGSRWPGDPKTRQKNSFHVLLLTWIHTGTGGLC